MGMAASQVRLLSLTSRLHDIEYKAQNIESQKIALATQKDEVYQAYCDALDATIIQVAYNNGDGTKSFVDANFTTLCTYNEDRFLQYALIDSKTNKVIVDQETYDAYENYSNDKYCFAFAMLGMDGDFDWKSDDDMGQAVGIGTAQDNYGYGDNLYMTEVEQAVYDANVGEDTDLEEAYNDMLEVCDDNSSTTKEKKAALEKFRDYLYDNYADEIYRYMRLNKNDDENTDPYSSSADFNGGFSEDFPSDEFNYYLNLFDAIQSAGGYQVIDPLYESGTEGSDWLNNMVSCGRVIIEVYNDSRDEWSETSIATSTGSNYLQETQDETDLKKAEAEYEYELDKINTKDTKFDQELSSLETERTAITTEIESIEKVRDENEERTFGIFS